MQPVRRFAVESVEPVLGPEPRRHAVLVARAGEGVDVVHLWTGDADFVASLALGTSIDLRVAPPGEPERLCAACRWCSTAPAFRGDAVARECLNPELRAEPMAEPGARFGGVAVQPGFGCVQWEAVSAHG